mgnify:CR=1 FL=1
MIYELEKIELLGISWLNYYTLCAIHTVGCLLVGFILVCADDEKKTLSDIASTFISFGVGLGVVTAILSTGIGEYTTHKVPLSTIGDKITVQGEKVVIDKFDSPYEYNSLTEKKDESNPKSNTEQIFKFEYNELYESGKLITEKGSYYELSKEDVRYLKERGAS